MMMAPRPMAWHPDIISRADIVTRAMDVIRPIIHADIDDYRLGRVYGRERDQRR